MGIKIYRYHARIIGEIPERVWQQARAMNALWNEMLEHYQAFLITVKPLYEDISNKELTKELWYKFDDLLVQTSRRDDWKEKLGWGAREAVLERFRTASKTTLKEKGLLRAKPTRLLKIAFYHRFSEGGWATDRIFKGKSKKLTLGPVPAELYFDERHSNRRRRYSKGIFGMGINDDPLPISVYLHRPIPPGKLKTAQFIGSFDELLKKWKWALLLAIDVADIREMKTLKPAAALDLNWRKIEDYIRVGFVKDTAGNSFEIRMPLFMPPSRRARNLLDSINFKRRQENQPEAQLKEFFPLNIYEIDEWQKRADDLRSAAKHEIRKIYETNDNSLISEPVTAFKENFDKIGRRGLLKLRWQISQLDNPTAQDRRTMQLLDAWQQSDHRLRLSIRQSYKYFANKRKKIYENLTLWLKNCYSYLVWENDLSLRKMAQLARQVSMHDSKQVGIKRGARYRQFAGLSILRELIKQHDLNDWLIPVKMANTTRLCRICKAECEVTSSRLIECANGHTVDVDDNSCANMLTAISEEFVYDTKNEEIKIPPQLLDYVVPVVTEG